MLCCLGSSHLFQVIRVLSRAFGEARWEKQGPVAGSRRAELKNRC